MIEEQIHHKLAAGAGMVHLAEGIFSRPEAVVGFNVRSRNDGVGVDLVVLCETSTHTIFCASKDVAKSELARMLFLIRESDPRCPQCSQDAEPVHAERIPGLFYCGHCKMLTNTIDGSSRGATPEESTGGCELCQNKDGHAFFCIAPETYLCSNGHLFLPPETEATSLPPETGEKSDGRSEEIGESGASN